MLIEYYFKIQYTKGTKNARVDVLSRKTKLQNNRKPLGAMLKKDSNGLIRYNYPKLAATQEYKLPKSNQTKRIQEVQAKDLDTIKYKTREAIYILKGITEEFIKEFYKGIIQGYNGVQGLVLRLQEEYIINGIQGLARKVIKEYLDC